MQTKFASETILAHKKSALLSAMEMRSSANYRRNLRRNLNWRSSDRGFAITTNKSVKYKDEDLNILRPLLNLEKNDLINISKIVFKFFIKDPSNINEIYKRTRIRTLLEFLAKEGLDLKKLKLTIDNLKDSDKSIKFYVNKNLKDNSAHIKTKDTYILNHNFFDQAHEVVFRSLPGYPERVHMS